MSEIHDAGGPRKGESSAEVARVAPEDADLLTIGHVCGAQREADIALLPRPLRIAKHPPPVLCADPTVAARRAGVCSRCRRRPVWDKPRKGKPRRLCLWCTRDAYETCVGPWPGNREASS